MRKKNYSLGQIPTPDDMNQQHLYTEEGFGTFLAAIASGKADVLFDNKPPGVVQVGANWQVSVLAQSAAIQGRPFTSPGATLSSIIADKQIGVWFVLRQTDVSEMRDRLRLVGSTPVRETVSMVVRKEESNRVELTESASVGDAPPTPVLGMDDVGYVLLATIVSLGGSSSVIHNTAAVWTFPGGGGGLAAHGPSHLPTGLDPIPVAAVGGTGSTAGLMPADALLVLVEAVQHVQPSVYSPYIEAVMSGDNSPADPKTATLRLRHHTSLEVKDVGGEDQLGVKFGSGPFAGGADVAARFDHTHEYQLATFRVRQEISLPTQLGTLIPLAPFSDLTDIVSIEVLWTPPGMTRPIPGIVCGWVVVSHQATTGLSGPSGVGGGAIGVRPVLVAANEVHLEIGDLGLTRFQNAVRQMIMSRFTGGGITWNSSTGDGNTPTSGELFVRVVGTK